MESATIKGNEPWYKTVTLYFKLQFFPLHTVYLIHVNPEKKNKAPDIKARHPHRIGQKAEYSKIGPSAMKEWK